MPLSQKVSRRKNIAKLEEVQEGTPGASSGSSKALPLLAEGRVRFTQELWKPSSGSFGNLYCL